MIRLRAALLLFLTPVLFLACSNEPDIETQDIVSTIPWTTGDRANYRLVDDGGREVGEGELTALLIGSNYQLASRFEGESSTDTSTVFVDAQTLKPVSSTRDIKTRDDEELIEVTYSNKETDPACTVEPPRGCATIKRGGQQSGMSVPEHSYDNDSSLWLLSLIHI